MKYTLNYYHLMLNHGVSEAIRDSLLSEAQEQFFLGLMLGRIINEDKCSHIVISVSTHFYSFINDQFIFKLRLSQPSQ